MDTKKDDSIELGDELNVDNVKNYKENQQQLSLEVEVEEIIKKLLTTRLQRIIIRSLGYTRFSERYKENLKRGFFSSYHNVLNTFLYIISYCHKPINENE